MCGISAIISLDGSVVPKEQLEKMNEKIRHRGPDDEGIKINGDVGLGHMRLSILDLSSAGHQPMKKYDYDLIFNGEIYNYLELRQVLISEHGLEFESDTDTEVLLAAYSVWGKDCLDRFNGMWSFVLHDHKNNELFCSRDRFGIKPMCYTTLDQKLIIASEVKQLTSFKEFKPVLNKRVAYQYLQYGLLNTSEESFFEGVKELRGGHNLIVDLTSKQYKIEKWYTLEKAKSPSKSYTEAQDDFKELLQNSIKLRIRSDVKVGSCLSGGLDSSSIVSFAAQEYQGLETVSSCSQEKKYDEREYIDEVVKFTKVESKKTFPDLNDLFIGDTLAKIIYHQDQPISSGSNFSEFKVFETAAKHKMIVMLDGQGADEYLAGYDEFFVNYWLKLLKSFQLRKLNAEITAYSIKRNKSRKATYKTLINFWFLHDLKARVKSLLKVNSALNWIDESFKKEAETNAPIRKFSSLKALSHYEILSTSIPYQLHSEDRNSMLHSVESRLPFMDYRLIENCINYPDGYKINQGRSKSILRDSLSEVLPSKIVKRYDKMGFVSADEKWIRDNHQAFRKILEEAIANLDGLVLPKMLSYYDAMIEGKQAYNNRFFRVLAFSKWKDIFKVTIT